MAEQNLRSKTIKGVGWSAADTILSQGTGFVVGIVLARLLTPEDYGVLGLIMIFVTVLNGMVDCGFSTSLIRKETTKSEDYDTMFYTNLVVSTFLYAILYIASPYISSFFNREDLTLLLRVMGSVLFINALSITQMTILTRRIDFKTKTKASFSSSVISGIIGITLAYCGFGVWSLVVQQLSKQAIYTVALWIYNKWIPSLTFSADSFRYMWGFGWKLLLSGILNNAWNQVYQIVVGKFYNPSTLGQYTRAREYSKIFSEILTMIVQKVSFPAMASIQSETERLVAAYRRIIKVTMFVAAICMFAMGAVAEPLIYCLIGSKWHEAASYLPLICISMSLYPLHAINLNMLQVQGRSDIFLHLEIIKKIIAVGPICLGIFVGIKAMLVGSIITGLISFYFNSYYTGKKLNYSSWMQLKDVAPSYFIATIIALSVYFFKFLPISNILILIIQILIGTTVFFVVCEIRKQEEYLEIKSIVTPIIIKIIKR